MSSAGQQLVAGRIPGERIATDIDTSDSAGFTTTVTQMMAVTGALVIGRIYKVVVHANLQTTVAGDIVSLEINENTVAGATVAATSIELPSTTGRGYKADLEFEYTAVATGNKTFVFAGSRGGGSGTVNMHAAGASPAYMYIDYIRG